MKAFIDENEPGLWRRLIEVEKTTGDFTDLAIAHRVDKLIGLKHPMCGRLEAMRLFVELRRAWSSE